MPTGIYKRNESHGRNISLGLKRVGHKPVGRGRGFKLSDATKLKISLSKIGKPNGRLGTHHSEETKRKMSNIALKQKRKPPLTQEIIKRAAKSRSGEKNFRWIYDRTKLKRNADKLKNKDSAYKEWRTTVYKRDGWKCKISDEYCKGRIEAHHILSWRDYYELRYEINNGITLCHAHHPRVRGEEKRLADYFQKLVSVSKD